PEVGKFSNTNNDSNSCCVAEKPLHLWISTNEVYSNWRASDCCACNTCNQVPSGASKLTTTRTGRVLMNSPTVASARGREAGRPATVTPNRTSSWLLYRLSKIAQAP